MRKGRAGLRDLTEPQEEGQQPGTPLEKTQGGGHVTPEHWEDKLEESAVDTQGGRAGSNSPSEPGGETKPDYVF